MSTNKDIVLLQCDKDSRNEDRKLVVYEKDNSVDFSFKNVEQKNIVLYAHTYCHILAKYEYKHDSFKYADVYVTNRFMMDTVKTSIDTTREKQVNLKECSQLFSRNDSANQYTVVELVLSMHDFEYGDVYIQFYDDTEEKDKYCAPIIVQFTNAPTVYLADAFKTNPSIASPDIEDIDNVFSSAYGSEFKETADTGRTDVLIRKTAVNSDYYNDLLSNDRLITNGLSKDSVESINGHPVYSVKYCSFIPSTFSEEFRN